MMPGIRSMLFGRRMGNGPQMFVGPVCKMGDTFATARHMDRVGPGELVVFRTAGAYAAAMSSTSIIRGR